MTQQPSGLSQAELQNFAQKLCQFRDSLNPSEQQVFTQLMRQAQSASNEVGGYDDGRTGIGPGDSPTLDLQNFPWPTVLGPTPGVRPPIDVQTDRKSFQGNR